jgi:O-antigen ligase
MPYHLEFLGFCGLSLVWLITAVLASVLNIRGVKIISVSLKNVMTVTAVLAWFTLFLHIGSAVIPFLQSRLQREAENIETGKTDPNVTDAVEASGASELSAPAVAPTAPTETTKTSS